MKTFYMRDPVAVDLEDVKVTDVVVILSREECDALDSATYHGGPDTVRNRPNLREPLMEVTIGFSRIADRNSHFKPVQSKRIRKRVGA
jgi:hypothetical protein